MTSSDVIHSFWIPEMGQKQDLVPGDDHRDRRHPDAHGRFTLVCTELCGLGHATMRAPVRVLEAGRVRRRGSTSCGRQPDAGGGGARATARRSSRAPAAAAATRSRRPAPTRRSGPGLDDLAAAAEQAGEPVDEFVRQSIVDPNAVLAEGYQPSVMPRDVRREPVHRGDRRARGVPDRGGVAVTALADHPTGHAPGATGRPARSAAS